MYINYSYADMDTIDIILLLCSYSLIAPICMAINEILFSCFRFLRSESSLYGKVGTLQHHKTFQCIVFSCSNEGLPGTVVLFVYKLLYIIQSIF